MSRISMLSIAVARILFALAICATTALAAESHFGRILIVEHPKATDSFVPNPEPVQKMVRQGLLRFTGSASIKDAWLSLVSTQDTIGIKVHSARGQVSGTRPAVVGPLVETLLEAGLPPGQIIIWDRRLVDLRLAGYVNLAAKYGVDTAGALDSGYDTNVFYPSSILGRLVYGDTEFNQKGDDVARNSYLSRLLTKRITKIISVTPLLNHNDAGVSGALHGLAMSSIDNTLRFEGADRLAIAVPEIYALPELADRVALNIVDALICQYRGEEISRYHYSTPLNQIWFSRDPVAIDLLAIHEIERQRRDPKTRKAPLQIYSNAALMELGLADTNRLRLERLELKE